MMKNGFDTIVYSIVLGLCDEIMYNDAILYPAVSVESLDVAPRCE